MSDGAVKTLHAGRGHYKSLAFDEAGHAARVPQRPGGVRARRSRRIASITGRPATPHGDRARLRRDARHAEGHGRQPRTPRRASRRTARGSILGDRRRRRPAPADPDDKTPDADQGRSLGYKDPLIQPMQKRPRSSRSAQRSYRAVVHLADKRFVQLATHDLPNVNAGDDAARADRHVRRCPTARKCRGTRPTTTSTCSI